MNRFDVDVSRAIGSIISARRIFPYWYELTKVMMTRGANDTQAVKKTVANHSRRWPERNPRADVLLWLPAAPFDAWGVSSTIFRTRGKRQIDYVFFFFFCSSSSMISLAVSNSPASANAAAIEVLSSLDILRLKAFLIRGTSASRSAGFLT